MSTITFWFLLIMGLIKIPIGLLNASKHGELKGRYDGTVQAMESLIGVLLILMAFEVI